MNSFEDLETWKKCRQLRQDILKLVKRFPVDEKWRLADQLIRSSRSVTANIAEGHGRFHYQDNLKFCRNARGSLNETLDHLICANDEEIISTNEFNDLRQKYNECHRLLNGYITFLTNKGSKPGI